VSISPELRAQCPPVSLHVAHVGGSVFLLCWRCGTLCEVHNVPQRQQSRNTEPRTRATCRETGEHWARSSGDMLTDRHAHHNTQLRYWGRSNEMRTATANNITKLLNNKLVQTTITHIWSEYCVQTLHQNITNNAASRNTSTAAVSYTVSVYLSIYAVRDC